MDAWTGGTSPASVLRWLRLLRREWDENKRLRETTYPRTPVDCLISELRGHLEFGPTISTNTFERCVAQFNEEVGVIVNAQGEEWFNDENGMGWRLPGESSGGRWRRRSR